jgi:hypothetical protein
MPTLRGISRTARQSACLWGIIGSVQCGSTVREEVNAIHFSALRPRVTMSAVPSRRDDLESAALMLIHLLTPNGLPWTRNGVPKTDAAHDRVQRDKRNVRPEDLCKGLPFEFEEFLRYCRRLKFQECPDYAGWHERFRELAVEEGFPASDDFIWPPPEVI